MGSVALSRRGNGGRAPPRIPYVSGKSVVPMPNVVLFPKTSFWLEPNLE